MNKIVKDYQKGDNHAFKVPVAIIAVISMFFSFGGFNLMAEGPMQKVNAALFALMCGIGVYIFWTLAIAFVPRQRTPLTRAIAMALMTIGMMIIFCISSLTNMMSFRGLDALEYDLKVSVQTLSTTLDQRYEQALAITSLATDLRGDSGQFRSYADEEALKGTYSGFAGSGAVHRSFVTVSYRLERLVDEAEAFSTANEARYNAVSAGLAEMRRISLQDLPLKVRARQIESKADEIQRHLANMDPRYLAASISRTAKALPGEIDLRVTYSRNRDIAAKQRLALERANDDVQQVSEKLSLIADEIAGREVAPLTRFETKSPAKAVIVHADNYIGFWVAALCADGIPVFIVIFLSLYFYRKTDEELAHDRLMAISVEEIMLGRLGLKAARLGALDERSNVYITGKVLGRDETGEPS